jgi:uncharacterized membrane protein YgcG
MLPLLATAGRMLATSAARGAISGGARTAAGGGGNIIKGMVKDKAEKEIKGKIVKVTTEKFLAKKTQLPNLNSSGTDSKGGALVKSESSALVKKESDNPLLDELLIIKSTLVTIKSLMDKSALFDKNEYTRKRKELERQKRKSKEDELEKKPSKTKKIGKGAPKPSGNIFDFITNYLLNVFLGSLANWAFNYIPQIIDVIKGISSGVDNLWKVLKFGIISLATNFPKQIKFLAKLSAKIFGGPIKLIGKLLFKAGSLLTGLLKKAGGYIFNLVGGPLKSIAKKILGQTGTEAAKKVAQTASKAAASGSKKAADLAATQGAKKLVGRLKAFSKIFKRVPVIGAILGIAIDLAMGEPLDRAIVGAIGASIGGAIGGAIGTGLIPIPVVGTAVGGFVGAAIGDWFAKSMYKNLTGRVSQAEKEASKVEQKAKGGKVQKLTRPTSGSSPSGITRETGVQKRTFESKESKKAVLNRSRPFAISQKAIKNSKSFFGDDQSKYLLKLSDGFKKSTFIGDLLRIGMAIAMGETILKSTTDGAADNMSYEMFKAYENGLIDVDDDIDTSSLSYSFRKWARNRIYAEVSASKKYQQNMKSRPGASSGDGGDGGGGDGGGGDGGGGGGQAGGAVEPSSIYSKMGFTKEDWDLFRNTVAKIESGGRYDIAGGSGGHYDGRYQMGAAAKTDGSRHAGVPDPGHTPSARAAFRKNPQLQETLFAGYTKANHTYLMGNAKYKNANPQRKLQILGYAHNQGMGGAERWLNTGQVGADGFGTKGTKYTDAIAAEFRKRGKGSGSTPPPTSDPIASAPPPSTSSAPSAPVSSESETTDFSKFAEILGDKKGKILGPKGESVELNMNAPFVSVPVKPAPQASQQPAKPSQAAVSSTKPKVSPSAISQSASYDRKSPSTIILPPPQQAANTALGSAGQTSRPRIDYDSSMLNSDSRNMFKQVLSAALY